MMRNFFFAQVSVLTMWLYKLLVNRIKDSFLLFGEEKNPYLSNKSVKFLSESYEGVYGKL